MRYIPETNVAGKLSSMLSDCVQELQVQLKSML